MKRIFAVTLFLLLSAVAGARDLNRYALILEDAPLATQVASRKELRTQAALDASARIESAQQSLRQELARRGIRVTGAVKTVLNAVFVAATAEQLGDLSGLPGVRGAAYMPPIRRHMDRAPGLVNTPQAWSLVGGMQNAGAGVKIGIVDTGIDQNHSAFQDPSLPMPANFPKCAGADCAYTSNKVIVARSYVRMLAAGTDASNPAADSRPDDYSPRDRVGHGTAAAMIAAGAQNAGPSATITGIAPKAYLGNYKVFGSPGINDTTFYDVLIQAMEDALKDGMDIITLSIGSPGLYGPQDIGAVCGETATNPCDVRADAVENMVKSGLIVVVSAGNDGDIGYRYPARNSIHTPGTAPSAITVGASTNAHDWTAAVRVTGAGAPTNLQAIPALFGTGPRPAAKLTAPLRDVSTLQDDGKACNPLTAGSLAGAFALIQRGNCTFKTKVDNAQNAGAVGVVLYQSDGTESIFSPSGLAETGIPAALIGNTDGRNLKNFLPAHPDLPTTLDPGWLAVTDTPDFVAYFSSRGPSIGNFNIKPELVAPGTGLYTATQRYDSNGEMYDPAGYTVTQGTSFSVPFVAGGAALLKQRSPSLTPAQVKSLLVNTANGAVRDDAGPARVVDVGAGRLDLAAALKGSLTMEPATLSFGLITSASLPVSRTLRVRNVASGASTVSLSVAGDADANTQLNLETNGFALNAGEYRDLAVRLQGTLPQPGQYQGFITVHAGGLSYRVPYLYLVGESIANNVFNVMGDGFAGYPSESKRTLAFRLIDRFGVPVAQEPARFRATVGGGTVDSADKSTDIYGIAAARVYLGATLGEQQFTGDAGGLTAYFDGRARPRPAISTGGVVNAASGQAGRGVSPGSYISIYGAALSDTTRVFSSPYLPISLAGVSVSFDVPSQKLSLPGRIHFVSAQQVNVQAPWELQGLNSVQMKVSIGDASTAVYNVPLNDNSPAAFEYQEAASGRLLAAALDENYGLIGSGNQARRGGRILLYCNGLGPVSDTPPTGEITPVQPLPTMRVPPVVTVGGLTAKVEFSGLAPYMVGLYQINLVLDPATPTGIQPVVITSNGVVSKTAYIPVQ